ncbi:CRE-LGC-44 protein [Aphelenchoides avenae]|nr:CRE-LGC-44 protein [Aphelenchus avenae]
MRRLIRFALSFVIAFFCTVLPATIGNQLDLHPFWINTAHEAYSAGIDLRRFHARKCTPLERARRVHYLSYDDFDPIEGLDRVEDLLRRHLYVAVNLTQLCEGLDKRYGRLPWYGVPQQVPGPAAAPSPEGAPSDALDDRPWLHEPMLGGEVKIISEGEQKAAGNDSSKPKLESEKPVQTKDKEQEKEAGHIGIDMAALGAEHLDSLKKSLENDTELDQIMRRFERMARTGEKPFSSTFLVPLMKKIKTPPALVENQTVDVRAGIHVQSISNFELATMDYDMDMWLRMAWRDPRLAHGYSSPVLVTEESFLRRLWRPDAFVVNSRDSRFHRVTFLNFYMFVFPGGEVFFEARLYVKAKSELVLCKYPHDSQIIYLKLSSIAFTDNVVRFRWFSRRKDAVRLNKNVQLPELYIESYSRGECDSRRKSGNFTCIEARFYMRRNAGYYLAQTYVPTALCVLFSWISVWLPEEFVEGRVFVALTVFLTLSAESNAAKETLPKVSYTKAIDIWFGFTATFVFATMLQALVVIGLEQRSREKKKYVDQKLEELSVREAQRLLQESKYLHRWGRGLDSFFKVAYPVIFLIFLIIYYFIIIQGAEDKCLREGQDRHTEL